MPWEVKGEGRILINDWESITMQVTWKLGLKGLVEFGQRWREEHSLTFQI